MDETKKRYGSKRDVTMKKKYVNNIIKSAEF